MKKGETILKLIFESCWTHEPKETYRIVCTQDNRFFGQYTKGKEKFDTESQIIRFETEIEQDIIDDLYGYMQDLQIPAFCQPFEVMDGAYYELTIGDYMSKSVFRWFYYLPEDRPWIPRGRVPLNLPACHRY